MNTRQIQPINIWTPNGNTEITYLSLFDFFDYHFDDGGGKVRYKLINVDTELGATDCFVGVIDVPSDIVQQWGASDDIIFQYVATALGLELI